MRRCKRRTSIVARLGVLGGSYGGYATLWVISHTNRYKAAVAERAVSDLQSENLGADFAGKNGLGGGYYSMGPAVGPGEHRLCEVLAADVRCERSHAADDPAFRRWIRARRSIRRCKSSRRSRSSGRPSSTSPFPNENHDLSRTGSPIHRVERLHLISDWLKKYLYG